MTTKMQEYKQGLQHIQDVRGTTEEVLYDHKEALAYAYTMRQIAERGTASKVTHGTQHVITYSLKKGLEKL
jgi:hypothetical protein